jgi:hypothetical protein
MAGHGGGRQTIFFISRAGADSEIAAEIGGILKAAGYDVILQQWDFLNRSFIQKMHDALREADHVIALLSPDYMKSDHCAAEWQNAIAADPLNKHGRLIVMRVGDCQPEGLLTSLAYWDLLPIRGDAQKVHQAVLTAARANPQRADFEAPPYFHRANLWMPPAEKIVHRKIEPVPGFTGRGAEFEALEATLWTKGGAAALTNSGSSLAAVRGLGGVGKTTLAREYAWRNQRTYGGIWWLEAEKRHGRLDELVTGLIELGERLIPGIQHMPDRDKAARAVLDYIEDSRFEQPWLLVYDNVENPRDLDGWTPRAGAHILITTRWQNWRGQAAELPVDVFTPEVAAAFLMARAGGASEDSLLTKPAAERLAADLGYLPLALDHARSYCEDGTIGFDEYRQALPEWIKEAPEDAAYPKPVFATFKLAIEKAAKECPEAETLMNMVAFMAPDSIPLSIVTPDLMSDVSRTKAAAALRKVSLIRLDADNAEAGKAGDTRTISMHRLVQAVARGRLTLGQRGEALNRLVKALESAFPEDPVRLFPHIVEVLQVLGQEEHRDLEASDAADRLARLIIIALRTIGSGSKVPAEYLEAFLSYFYEVDPLIGALDVLMREHWHVWPRLQERLLAADNYVLRYAMASSLANACTGDAPFAGVEEVAALTGESKTLNEFELGGYALALIYARNPASIDPANLQKLAARREYPGRSILGDFLLNLVFRTDIDCSRNLRALVQSERYWTPIWDLIKLDVWAIEAAEAFNATPRRLPPGAAPEVKATFKSFEEIERNIAKTLQQANLGEELRSLLGKYFFLGQHTDQIQAAQQELNTKSHAELTGLMRIFFAHPIWAVAEAAATVLSGLVENDRDRLKIIAELSKDENWRVKFGANEAAFAVRHIDESTFFNGVKKLHNHWNCKIRGLCAENLTSHILNSRTATRDALLKQFEKEIQYWLSKEDDCWVFEHVFHLFGSLSKQGADTRWLFPARLSPLLKGAPNWYELERAEFLRHIETRKEELAQPSFLARFTRRLLPA